MKGELNMKYSDIRIYEIPNVEIIFFEKEDIITSSNETPGMPYSLMIKQENTQE